MRIFKWIMGLAAAGLLCATSAQATIFVPDYGDTGDQMFMYMFDSEWSGNVTIGVSDEGDDDFSSWLSAWDIPGTDANILLDTGGSNLVATNMYANDWGESGIEGELFSFNFYAQAGDYLTFKWRFYTSDYDPYNDFAFISFGDHYDVLAQIGGTEVPTPAPLPLLLMGLITLVFTRRYSAR